MGTWRLKKGEFVLTNDACAKLGLSARLESLVEKMVGTPPQNNDLRVNEGRIAFPTPNEMKMQWFDRVSETYGKFDNIPWERTESSDFDEDLRSR